MHLRKTLNVAALAATATFVNVAWAQSSSLEQSVEKTVLSNPEVRARFQDFQSTLEGQNVVNGGLLPQVTAQGWTGREWRGSTSEDESAHWGRSGYSLQLRQLLFDGFSTINNVKQLGFEKLSGYYELLATVDNLAIEAANAHLDVQRYREMEHLARDNFGVHETTLKQLRERQESGVGRGVDLEQANGRLALAQSNLMTESNNLNDVNQRYRRVVGEYPPATLLDAPDVSGFLPKDPKDFMGSLRGNPSILAKQALVQAAQAGVSSAKGRHAPTLELQAATGKDRAQPGTPYRDAQSSNVQLVLSYNLFRGGADQARVRQTTAQSYAARDVRDYTCRNVQQDLSVAWNNIIKLREQLPFLREHEMATAKVRTAYMQQFQIGQRSLLDLLDTENELFDSRRALANAVFDLKKAEYRWLALSHQVLPAIAISQPYNDAPEEAAGLDFPEESLTACLTPAPDTSNLKPVALEYRNGMLPPVIKTTVPGNRQIQ
ncbi:TolC family outer membrane protein [Pollutimonas bauzanensis]|uniref:Outer membrane protein, adhesin transport system n=1 Tax=Pollutimonas bauzanensis TaxID=658167 RepID=A0A1M6B9R1_9BURK|nr:outer membrane protein, adhesin transport system [Pollutimonas bauzanensis]